MCDWKGLSLIFNCLRQLLYSPFHYFEFFCPFNVDSFTFHVLCGDGSWIIFQNICNNHLFNRTPLVRHVLLWTSGLFFTSYSQLAETCGESLKEFHPLSLYYPCWAIGCPENLWIFPPIPDFRNLGSRLRTSRLRITNSKWPPQNPLYSKRMWGLPVHSRTNWSWKKDKSPGHCSHFCVTSRFNVQK